MLRDEPLKFGLSPILIGSTWGEYFPFVRRFDNELRGRTMSIFSFFPIITLM